ncbi:MAG: GIY-YIG nuclease family protein [Planctomycetota bacterium]
MSLQQYRTNQLRRLTNEIGVYALCDLDGVPVYIGQSVDGIRTRARRHLTSARSDVVANRQIDVWEIAFVWGWPVAAKADVAMAEETLFHEYEARQPLMNGSVPPKPKSKWPIPEPDRVQILPDDEIERRLEPRERFPRQAQHLTLLLDYILETKDAPHLRRSLDAHYQRMKRYYETFQTGHLAGE